MSEDARTLTNGARSQWNTLDRLMRVSRDSIDPETRRKVQKEAQAARRAVAECSATPENVERLEGLSTSIDRVLEEVSESSESSAA